MTDQCIFYDHLASITKLLPQNVTPNHITLTTVIPSTLALYNLYQGKPIIFYLWFVVRYFLDCWDGYYARTTNQMTKFGDLLDHGLDFAFFTTFFVIYYLKYYKTDPIKLTLAAAPSIALVLMYNVKCEQVIKKLSKIGFTLLSIIFYYLLA